MSIDVFTRIPWYLVAMGGGLIVLVVVVAVIAICTARRK
jgi:hypothetical protein